MQNPVALLVEDLKEVVKRLEGDLDDPKNDQLEHVNEFVRIIWPLTVAFMTDRLVMNYKKAFNYPVDDDSNEGDYND